MISVVNEILRVWLLTDQGTLARVRSGFAFRRWMVMNSVTDRQQFHRVKQKAHIQFPG